MNKKILFSFVSTLSLMFLLASSVEAKRFGGGSSFGSKKSYSSPFKQKTTQQKSFSQQKASATNQQRKQQLSKRGGIMGMLGGLALGGLLGALFFGGAFENFNFFDFLIIGGIIWAIFWFMKRKALRPQAQSATAGAAGAYDMNSQSAHSDAEPYLKKEETQFKLNSDKTDADFSTEQNTSQTSSTKKDASFAESFGMNFNQSQESEQTHQTNEVILPEWFNQDEFLNGARSAYTLLQEAWDKGDLNSIKELTTEVVFNEISAQFANESSQGKTRIVQLNAELIDFNELDDHCEASVLFDALLDESDTHSGRSTQVRELWHFVRSNNSNEPTWYLDGLQQLE
ncbi:MAG: Tim44-like domain-containing protein [Gammaproteobacteria bacterium]|nr:Tim44-like domain-containing protein [Gammaproteobacteria bacterium]